jgi:1,2-diacylglycerol 3-beta-galactosyltransferase
VLTLALYEVMGELVREYQPDVIVSTYPMYQSALVAYFALNEICVPLIVVVTDLATVHRLWFEPDVDLCLVPTEMVKKLALENGIKEEKVRITGIPVSPRFANNTRSKEDIRAELNWDPYLPTFLAVGSQRVERMVETLNVLNHFGLPLQVAATAGRDYGLMDKLKEMDWHIPFHIYGYVDNMPDMMLASDAIIGKAGGLMVTEALACGLPIMLVDMIPGQEEGNRDFVVENGAGVMVEKPIEVLEALAHWMKDDWQGLKVAVENARRIGRPNAAMDAADRIWGAAQHGPQGAVAISELRRTRLIDLLTRNQIKLDNKKKFSKKK